MMMPANYSVIAENEMTYVNGGAFIDCLAPVMTDKNWQNLNVNLIKIIGNSFMTSFVGNTLGVIFRGDYEFGKVTNGIIGKLNTVAQQGTGAVTAWGVVNAGLQVLGGLASIYTLGRSEISTGSATFTVA